MPKRHYAPDDKQALVATVSGRLVEVVRTRSGSAEVFYVDRLEFTAPLAAGPLTITLDPGTSWSRDHSYQVVSDWQLPPRPAEVIVLNDQYRESKWTCSYTTAAMLTPSVDASAYRLEWATSADEYRAGRRKTLIFPHDDHAFFGQPTGIASLGLGHLNCFGETLPVARTPVYVGIAALYPDGTEVPASAAPWETRTDRSEPANPPEPDLASAQPARARGFSPDARHYGAALLLLGVLLILLRRCSWTRKR